MLAFLDLLEDQISDGENMASYDVFMVATYTLEVSYQLGHGDVSCLFKDV